MRPFHRSTDCGKPELMSAVNPELMSSGVELTNGPGYLGCDPGVSASPSYL
jgi:hypothetical protein